MLYEYWQDKMPSIQWWNAPLKKKKSSRFKGPIYMGFSFMPPLEIAEIFDFFLALSRCKARYLRY